MVEEFRDDFALHQLSYCYLISQKNGNTPTEYTDDEIADGAELFLASDINHAIELLQDTNPTDYEGRFIRIRDLAILNRAKELLSTL